MFQTSNKQPSKIFDVHRIHLFLVFWNMQLFFVSNMLNIGQFDKQQQWKNSILDVVL